MSFPPATEIRKRRKALDITQNELSQMSGVSQSTIAKIENGRISASYDTVVTLFETLDEMKQSGGRDMTAEDVCSKKVKTIQVDASVHEASKLMRDSGFSPLPVLDGDLPVGSISERSIFEMLRQGYTMDQMRNMVVSKIMAESFPVVSDVTPITSVTSLMSDSNAVLVSRKGKIVGMITNADMLKLL